MKKIVLLTISVLGFVILFYQMEIGLNFGILAFLIWGLIHFITPEIKHGRFYWLLSCCVFIAGMSQMWYADEWTFITLYLTLLVFGIYAQYQRLSIVTYPFVVAINYILFPFRFLSFRWLPKSVESNNPLKKIVAYVLIPLIILILFAAVYITGSESFYNFFQSVFNIEFWRILFLTAEGTFFFFNFWLLFIPRPLISINSELSEDFGQCMDRTAPAFDTDLIRKSGEITMSLVNLLLLFFVITYNYEQFFVEQEITQLSNDTHLQVFTIIFSIVMAIGLILLYFGSKISYDAKSDRLRVLSYLWLVLNTILVLSAFIKNGEYIYHYGLTFKRAGVFIFLTLCYIGMWFAYLKIRDRKTSYFLINRMAWVFFFTMVVTTAINFSWLVTQYNLTFQKQPDFNYLNSLNYNYHILSRHKNRNPNWEEYQLRLKNRQLNKDYPILYRKLYDMIVVE